MQFEEKTIFYNKKNFYVKKLGAVRPNVTAKIIIISVYCSSE